MRCARGSAARKGLANNIKYPPCQPDEKILSQWDNNDAIHFDDSEFIQRVEEIFRHTNDEECNKGYLKLNPDVAAVIREGGTQSGFEHWKEHGKRGGRTPYCKEWLNIDFPYYFDNSVWELLKERVP